MSRELVVGDLRVQELSHRDGRVSYTILWPEGAVHEEADRFLRKHEGSGTQRTYAYLLVDHLRWMERECLRLDSVTLPDLERYMGLLGADVQAPLGEAWRAGRRPYGKDALSVMASCLKGFYLMQAALGVNSDLGLVLDRVRLPTRADRNRSLLGHVKASMPANPLAPRRPRRRHPKMLPEGARERLLESMTTARDRLVATWLTDGGFRIGELCGLHLSDLHLRADSACRDLRAPHAHVCHRSANTNRSAAKTKHPWSLENGIITGGLIKRVSPAMIHRYFDYMTTEYPAHAAHGMLLVQLHGKNHGQPWSTDAARGMFRRASQRGGLGLVKPHQYRHEFATAVLEASGGNLLVARDAGGWASTAVVDEIYAHVDVDDPVLDKALRTVWGEG